MNGRLPNDREGNLTSLYSDVHSAVVVTLRCMFDENQNDDKQIVDNSLNREKSMGP